MRSQKRLPEDGKAWSESRGVDDSRRKMPRLKRVVSEVMKMKSVQHMLEPLIRRVVKEEIEVAMNKHLSNMTWSCAKEVYPVELKYVRLQFLNSICLPVFTGARIEGGGCSPVRIALVDGQSGEVIRSGPESSAKVEVVVLEGDFDGDEGTNWTSKEFENNRVREREGKKPLLSGDVLLNLNEGIGIVGDILFTDNSSWTRSRRFRLGARVVDDFDGIRILEAKTESFIVRDHRGELYKKHHPPSLYDEVWRLEKIGKDGAFHKRLTRDKIYSVKDFLTLLILDPLRLRNILGTGMSAKMWEVTVDHARTCVMDKRSYLYYLPGSQKKSGVVFNIVGKLMGVLSDCQYVAMDKLSESQKVDAQNIVVLAYQHWEEVISFGDESSLTGGSSQLKDTTCGSSSPRIESPDVNKVFPSRKINELHHVQPTSPIYSIGGMSSLDDFALHGIGSITLDHSFGYPGQVENSLIFDTGSMAQPYLDKDDLQFFDSDNHIQSRNCIFDSPADLQCAVDGFLYTPSAAVKIDKAQRRWTKLFSVLKWFSVRKTVRSRSEQIQRYSYAF